jgi:O-glycosyl hydrolase
MASQSRRRVPPSTALLSVLVLFGLPGIGGQLHLPIQADAAATSIARTSFHVSGGGEDFNASLPASSVATFTWHPGSGQVQEYLTTSNGSSLGEEVQPQPTITPSTVTPPGALAILVDPSQVGQVMTGFGGAMTDSAATLINQSPARSAIMQALFGASGARFNFVRLPMGATDLVATNYQSYDDSSSPDPNLNNFSHRP